MVEQRCTYSYFGAVASCPPTVYARLRYPLLQPLLFLSLSLCLSHLLSSSISLSLSISYSLFLCLSHSLSSSLSLSPSLSLSLTQLFLLFTLFMSSCYSIPACFLIFSHFCLFSLFTTHQKSSMHLLWNTILSPGSTEYDFSDKNHLPIPAFSSSKTTFIRQK